MTPRATTPLPLLLLSCLSACGGPDAPVEPCPPAPEALACVDGATLAPVPRAEFPASAVGLVPAVERTLEIAGEVWGVEPAELLTGWTIEYSRGWFLCPAVPEPVWTYGCTFPSLRLIRIAPGDVWHCLPGVLVHELGHVLLGDPTHRDPRFAIASGREGEGCR